jgi:hypothetical protein
MSLLTSPYSGGVGIAPPTGLLPATDPLAALRAALIAQNPTADWNAGGVDRASELAGMFNARGITDISKIGLGSYGGAAPTMDQFLNQYHEDGSTTGYGDAKSQYDSAMADYNKLQSLTYGDQRFGDLMDSSNPSIGADGKIGWSAAGDNGGANFYAVKQPDGTIKFEPMWTSSSDWGTARSAAKAAATFAAIAGTAGAATGAFGAGAAEGAGVLGNGAFLGEGVASGIPAWDAAVGSGVLGGAGAAGAAGNGAFLGEGVSSGVPAWDAATGSGVLGSAAGSAAGFPGEGAVSGVPAWDAAPGSGVLGSAASTAVNAATPTSGSGLLGQAGTFLANNPSLAKLIGAGLGGLIGRAVSGPPNSGGGQPQSVNMNARAMTPGTSTLMDTPPSQGLPSGLGSSSAGLFDEYMKKQLGGGRRIFNAPTFGGG